jgi:hypothetical protein
MILKEKISYITIIKMEKDKQNKTPSADPRKRRG